MNNKEYVLCMCSTTYHKCIHYVLQIYTNKNEKSNEYLKELKPKITSKSQVKEWEIGHLQSAGNVHKKSEANTNQGTI